MKKLILFLGFLAILPCVMGVSLYAQSWVWGAQGRGISLPSASPTRVATDRQGNAYITGQVYDTVVFGTDTLKNGAAAFLTKYNANGAVEWARQPIKKGSRCISYSTSVSTDPLGNVFITGWYSDTIQFGSYILTPSTNEYNVFLVKYDPSGNVLWAQQSRNRFGGGGLGNLISLATDYVGNAYINGTFYDTISFGSDILISGMPFSSTNVFLVKYDANGNEMWAKQSKGKAFEVLNQGNIAADRTGNIYITGNFSDTISFGTDTLFKGDIFLVKYDANGNVVWATKSIDNTNGYAEAQSIAIDNSGAAYIAGIFVGSESFGSYTVNNGNAFNPSLFLVKYTSNGNVVFVKQTLPIYIGGFDPSSSLASDTDNHIYLAFRSDSINSFGGFDFAAPLPPNISDDGILCIAQLDTAGSVECGSAIQSSFYPRTFNGIAADNSGTYVYTAGTLEMDIITFGANTLTESKGAEQPYVARWRPCQRIASNASSTEPCDSLVVPNVFTPNNDGINDQFTIYVGTPDSYNLKIYDRWGLEEFESNSPFISWDGRTPSGIEVPAGVYYFVLKTSCNGKSNDRQGFLQLIRSR